MTFLVYVCSLLCTVTGWVSLMFKKRRSVLVSKTWFRNQVIMRLH